ncbi:MAG: YdeI/OmpD-associated family protein [Flavobacteriales bacterium]|nr:YdeI/OmpD-associated family protein [Flavobacteriales bacterium]MCB9174985.1 YdeI/OmpD-associated family protein [Flavobacteriales bacterium]
MPKNPKVDEYIAKSAEFAQPILSKLRALVHQVNPDIEETIKWGMPNFEYKGMLFNMAAFKQHCAFGFWKQKLIKSLDGAEDGMGSFGKIKSLNDLPSDEILLMLMQEAVMLNEKGIQLPKVVKEKKNLVVPKELKDVLQQHPKAKEVFDNFAYTHQKEYIEWITEAKQDSTKQKRITQTIEWLLEGKNRNWKYQNC